jgi:thiol-disulfide isomerase/thioredoxin|tara:strand:+ start:403 stop:873 length:471 start_codon:yes stop_codon:yes gene_type:complete
MDFSTQNLMSNKYVIIAVLSLLFIVIGFFVYKSYVGSSDSSPTMTDDIYDDGSDVSDSSDAELMFFHVDWCPHCKTALPEWEKIKKEYNNKKINGHRILFLEYNCTEETEETTKKIETYKIEGYPTIKLKIDGRVIEFDAKVNKENMEQFLSTVLA